MIYTSNYSCDMNNPNALAISKGKPKGFKYSNIKELEPMSWSMVRMGDWGKFKALYNAQLETLDVKEMAQRCEGKVLLCWESSKNHCHRQLVILWFEKNGFKCEELAP